MRQMTMPLIPIDSLADPRVQPYLDLRNKRLRTRDGKFIAEGDLVVSRLLESGYQVESLVVAEDQLDRLHVPRARRRVRDPARPDRVADRLQVPSGHPGVRHPPGAGGLVELCVAPDRDPRPWSSAPPFTTRRTWVASCGTARRSAWIWSW